MYVEYRVAQNQGKQVLRISHEILSSLDEISSAAQLLFFWRSAQFSILYQVSFSDLFLPAAKLSGLREQITLCFRPSVVRPRTSSLVSSVLVEYHKLRIFGHRGYPWWNLTSRKNWLPGKIDFPENESSREMRIFAFMGIIFKGYLDIRTSWIFGHYGYLDITDIQTLWIFGHHGYHHGNLDIMYTRTSWIFGHDGYSDIINIRTSWIFRYHGYFDIWISWIS